jgi:hypothetical protein
MQGELARQARIGRVIRFIIGLDARCPMRVAEASISPEVKSFQKDLWQSLEREHLLMNDDVPPSEITYCMACR